MVDWIKNIKFLFSFSPEGGGFIPFFAIHICHQLYFFAPPPFSPTLLTNISFLISLTEADCKINRFKRFSYNFRICPKEKFEQKKPLEHYNIKLYSGAINTLWKKAKKIKNKKKSEKKKRKKKKGKSKSKRKKGEKTKKKKAKKTEK